MRKNAAVNMSNWKKKQITNCKKHTTYKSTMGKTNVNETLFFKFSAARVVYLSDCDTIECLTMNKVGWIWSKKNLKHYIGALNCNSS